MIERRLDAVRTALHTRRLDALLVTFLPHVRYLTNFSGSNAVCLITRDAQFFLTDGRYTSQTAEEVRSYEIIITRKSLFEEAAKRKMLRGFSRVGIEAGVLTVAQFGNLKKLFPRVKFVHVSSLLEELVAVKDDSEIRLIEHAVSITEKVFEKILGVLRPGTKELDIAAEISYLHKKFGAEADAFEPIVASGPRGALPHARASTKQIRNGEMVTLDFGCRYQGYHSDLTRTVAVGKPVAEVRKIYSVVLDAQVKAVEAARAGMNVRALDAVARKHIKGAGYGKFFNHSLGHGLGLQVHESPRLSQQSKEKLKAGNVVTIEPGIYLPNVGGVRIEDDVVIQNGSCRLLTKSTKKLIVL